MNDKRKIMVLVGISLVALVVVGWLVLHFTAVPEGKVQSFAAAMAVLEENGDKSKDRLLKKADRRKAWKFSMIMSI